MTNYILCNKNMLNIHCLINYIYGKKTNWWFQPPLKNDGVRQIGSSSQLFLEHQIPWFQLPPTRYDIPFIVIYI